MEISIFLAKVIGIYLVIDGLSAIIMYKELIPVVAEIPKNKTKKYVVVQKGERSLVAEAFRMLRNNMNFLLPKNKEGGNVIFISSAIAGEGKTFNAINLAWDAVQRWRLLQEAKLIRNRSDSYRAHLDEGDAFARTRGLPVDLGFSKPDVISG